MSEETVKRYDPVAVYVCHSGEFIGGMEESLYGCYVSLEDYEELVQELRDSERVVQRIGNKLMDIYQSI